MAQKSGAVAPENVAPSTEVAKVRYTVADLASIEDFNSLKDLFVATDTGFEDAGQYGTGFRILPTGKKESLIGKSMMLLEWHYSTGDSGEFVSAVAVIKGTVILEGDEVCKVIINDGSTGIRDQLKMIDEQRRERGVEGNALYVKRGLRVSRYDHVDEATGQVTKAETYYLDMS